MVVNEGPREVSEDRMEEIVGRLVGNEVLMGGHGRHYRHHRCYEYQWNLEEAGQFQWSSVLVDRYKSSWEE
jgi:hypothetical protein